MGNVDTNQLKNTMATISPNGRFIAAAAFTADVKVTFLPSINFDPDISYDWQFSSLCLGSSFRDKMSRSLYHERATLILIYDIKCVSS